MIQRFLDDDFLKALLVFAPFFLSISALEIGFSMGLISFTLILCLSPVIYFSRKLFILPQQRVAFVLVISVSWLLIMRMFIDAEAYSLAGKTGLFFPLLLMNSFLLSTNESILSMPDFKSVMTRIFRVGIAILLFFIILGFLRSILNDIALFSAPAGFFLISGFLLATMNFLNKKRLSHQKKELIGIE